MDGRTVLAFLTLDLLLVFTPGADWAFVVATGSRERSVVPAVAGLVAGYAGHTALVVAGLAVVVARSPTVLAVLTFAGAGYLVWLGCTVLARPTAPVAAAASGTRWRVALRGLATSVLNPKGLLLYLALLPQFVDLGAAWSPAAQTAVLGALHITGCAVVYLAVGMSARRLLAARPTATRVVTRVAGLAMVGVGVFLVVEHFVG